MLHIIIHCTSYLYHKHGHNLFKHICVSFLSFFKIHQLIFKETIASVPMKELTSSMIGECDELQNQNKNRIESLVIFINCKTMVRWLQENIKSRLNPKNNIVIARYISDSDIYDLINKTNVCTMKMKVKTSKSLSPV